MKFPLFLTKNWEYDFMKKIGEAYVSRSEKIWIFSDEIGRTGAVK